MAKYYHNSVIITIIRLHLATSILQPGAIEDHCLRKASGGSNYAMIFLRTDIMHTRIGVSVRGAFGWVGVVSAS